MIILGIRIFSLNLKISFSRADKKMFLHVCCLKSKGLMRGAALHAD